MKVCYCQKMAGKFTFFFFIFFFSNVTPWTIDLPELRKVVFEKNEYFDKNKDHVEIKDQFYYSNREGNSLHNTKHREHHEEHWSPYAKEYGYQTYMEKRVHDIVYHGSRYLEGLQRSLERYSHVLHECKRFKEHGDSYYKGRSDVDMASCMKVSRASEHVRRLAELAMWTTRELQDIAYSKKYKKGDYSELVRSENELILKLAWFLDRLAHYTGYIPEHTDIHKHTYQRESPSTTTASTTTFTILDVPEPVKRLMMDCLKTHSSEAATARCQYNEPLSPVAQLLLNYTDEGASRLFSPSSTPPNINDQVVPITNTEQTRSTEELLQTSDSDTPKSIQKRSLPSMAKLDITKLPPLSAVKVKKRAIVDKLSKLKSAVKIKKRGLFKVSKVKRSAENPAQNFLKYFSKTKAWVNDNIYTNVDTDSVMDEYEVKNQLEHKINRRSIDRISTKKSKHFLPDDPFQDLSKYVQHKTGVNYIKDDDQASKLKAYLEKLHSTSAVAKKHLKILSKMTSRIKRAIKFENNVNDPIETSIPKTTHREKRYIKFESDVDKPRHLSFPDLSLYVKNKPGTNYNANKLQAAEVRAGLEQIFQRPDIETVRRYGANYNPAIPSPFYFGVMRGMADNI